MKRVQIRSYFWSVFSCIRTEYGDLLRNTRNFFTICEPLKMLLCHFCKSDFINFRATFAKTLLKKSLFLWQIFKTFIKLCYLSKFYHVEIFKRIIAALWIFFAFYRKICFLCLLLSLGISYYYLFIATENCKNVCIFQFWIS